MESYINNVYIKRWQFVNYKVSVPEWWNWQTRRTQNPVELKLRGGSSPPSGTKFSKGYAA